MPTTEANSSPEGGGLIQEVTRVAVGVIVRQTSNNNITQVCISLRPKHLHKGGLWEFPGGKIEQGETAETALERELKEELGIQAQVIELMMQISWNYKEKNVFLDVLKVTDFEGEVSGLEGQQVRWVELNQLDSYQFPEANEAIIDRLLNR